MTAPFRVCACVPGSTSDVDRECGADVTEERSELHAAASPQRLGHQLSHPPYLPVHLGDQENGDHC